MMKRTLIWMTAAALALVTAGCATGPGGVEPAAANPAAGLTGRAMGGQSAITGGSVTMWKVNTNGTAATSMLTTPVTTDSNGYFTLTGDYSNCSATLNPTTQVYIMITGGNPGLSGNNSALALMAALGPCSGLASIPFVDVNEVTTVASVWALQQFMGVTYGVAGAEDVAVNTMAQSVTGMINAFSTVPVLTTLAQGSAVSSVSNATIESSKINTIANILSTCVNSNGTGLCADLFAAVTPSGDTTPADTIQAALYMALNPTNNITQIYGFQTGTGAPFSPNLSSAPYDWTLGVFYSTGGSVSSPVLPYYIASDASGNLWMGDGGGSSADGLLELGPTGQAASGSPFLSGSSTPVNAPETVAVDTVGNIWLANNGSSKNDLISFPGTGSSYTAHTATSGCLPEAMAIDGSNNAYFACSGVTNLFKFANTGTVGSPSYGSTATQYGAVGSTPYGVAVDTTGNVWVGSYGSSTISEFPVGFTTSTTPTTYGLSASPYNVAVDNSGNIWSVSSSTLFELLKSGTSYSVNSFTGGGLNSARALAIDGGNDIWVANEATTAISGTTYVSVSEFTDSGTAITVENYEDLPGGYPKALPSSVGTPYMRSLAIDPSGNVWVAGCGLSTSCNTGANSFVLEIVGAATPPVVPLSTAIANDELGCCSFTPTAPGGTPPTSAGYLTLQASSYSPMRDSGSLSFLVTRNGGSTGTVSVSYATSNGTATAGTDYTSTSGTLSWASGNTTSQTITVPWLNTSSYTGSKTFTLTLSSATGGASITPYTSTAVSVSTQVTSSVISANTYPFFANAGNGTNTAPSASVPFYITPPSTYFTLGGTNYTWKLQDPIDIYGGTGGTNGSQFQDEQVTSLSGYSSPYFYLNTNNQMVFSAPSNGAVTEAPGSNGATRSELREEFTGTNNDGSGDWYAYKNNGTITGGTMTGTCKVISVSAGSDETTFAQIHAVGANPFTLLIVKPSNGDVEIRMVNTSANLSSTYAQIIPAYTLGDTISYSLSYSAPSSTSAGTLTVQATDTTTGSTSGQVTLSVDSSWSPIAEYFKLGAYQGGLNTGNLSSAYSQTVYTTWSITH